MAMNIISVLACIVSIFNGPVLPPDPTGKTYKALISESCKQMADGGCMIYEYRTLSFREDSVVVSYRVTASCSVKEREKNYDRPYDNLTRIRKWTITNNIIAIEGVSDWSRLVMQDSVLIGEDTAARKTVIFSEERR
jgi:hypothetical protein